MDVVFPIQLTQQTNYTTSLYTIAEQLARETSEPARKFTELRTALNTDEYWQSKARKIAQDLAIQPPILSTDSDQTGLTKLINREQAANIITAEQARSPRLQEVTRRLNTMMTSQAELLINFVQAIIAKEHHFRINTDDNQIAIAVSDDVLLYKKQGDTEYYTLENTSTHEGLEVKDQHTTGSNRDLTIRRYSTQGTEPDLTYHRGAGEASTNIAKRDPAWLAIKQDSEAQAEQTSSETPITIY